MAKPLFQVEAKNKNEADFYLHGKIGLSIDAELFHAKLKELEASYKVINIRMHSPGGGILDGLDMYNKIKNSPSTINIIVEGIAASWGAILLQAGAKRIAARHSRIMIHQSSGGARGSSTQMRNYADLMDSLNETMAEILAERTGKHKDWIKSNWMQAGQDKWFTAEEAKAAGLIDEIIDNGVKAPKAEASYEEILAHFTEEVEAIYKQNPNPNNNKPTRMDKSEILLLLAGCGITFENLSAETSDSEFKASLKTGLKVLKNDADKVAALEAKLEELEGSELEAVLLDAVKTGKINAKQEAHYRKMAEGMGSEAVIACLGEIEAPSGVRAHVEASKERKPSEKERDNWTYSMWEEKDPKGLSKMADEDPEKFEGLVAAYESTAE